MSKIKKFIILYPSWERGGATVNLINFINYCTKKKIQTHLISNINNKDQKTFFTKGVNFVKIKDSKNLEKVTRIFFNHRRKMIKNPFNQLFNVDQRIHDKLKINFAFLWP